jgi:hypothetical protein
MRNSFIIISSSFLEAAREWWSLVSHVSRHFTFLYPNLGKNLALSVVCVTQLPCLFFPSPDGPVLAFRLVEHVTKSQHNFSIIFFSSNVFVSILF